MTPEERKRKLPLVLGALPFLMGGLDGISEGHYAVGVVNVLMAVANLIAARFVDRSPEMTNVVIHCCNAVVAVIVGYDYFLQGKKGLPYAWCVAAVFFLVVAIRGYRRAAD